MREHGTKKSDGTLVLGDQWEDWDGDVDSHEGEIHETARPFTAFLILVFFLYWCAAAVLGYLVYPRLAADVHPVVAEATVAAIGVLIGLSAVWLFFILLSVAFGKAVLVGGRVSRGVVCHFLRPMLLRLAGIFGFSRDRIGHSFIKLNNILSKKAGCACSKTIVLLPRCLRKDVRARVLELAEQYGVPAHTVGGGEQARKVVSKEKPDSLVAVACERDLTSGIRDTAPSLAVIGIPNIRREGPCRNTEIDIPEFEEALRFFKGGGV